MNSWKVPITEKMTVSSSAGRIAGILIDQAIRFSDAPSTRAASYSSPEIDRSAA